MEKSCKTEFTQTCKDIDKYMLFYACRDRDMSVETLRER